MKGMFIALALLAVSGVLADELVLNGGSRYKGTISRNDKGQGEIVTSKGKFAYDDEKVNYKLTKISEPSDYADYQKALKAKNFEKIAAIAGDWGKRYSGMPVRYNELALYGKILVAGNAGNGEEAKKLIAEYGKFFGDGSFKGEIDVLDLTLRAKDMDRDELKATYAKVLAGKPASEAAAARMHLALGKLQLEDGENMKALENFASVVVLYGDIPDLENEAIYGCGEAYFALGEGKKAAFYYNQLAGDKDNPFAAKAKAKLEKIK